MSITRAAYHTAVTACIARINLEMERNNLTPADIQKRTVAWVLSGEEQHAVTMQDLYQYRKGAALPKRGKLEVLAKVLQCHPSELVPVHLQEKRIRVRSRVNYQPDASNERMLEITPHPTYDNHVTLKVEVILPPEEAYKLSAILTKRHYIADARRRGMSEEWIKETFDPTPMPQMPAPEDTAIVAGD